ncbi:MAG: 16S rRNA (uracil(1498)-N(3))-methyltransferase [Desulfovibrionaceae bacterium]|nr:16S rRNA (uracil(1498)-N(3))-methyltransferase [Desulfovibrionaceae bacterium]
MARLNSFYLPGRDWKEPYSLAGPEARHMLGVLRTAVGDEVRLFDGQGREGLFRLVSAAKNRALLEPIEISLAQRPEDRLYLACGWSRSGRRDLVLEKAVELEAAGIAFWQAERSQGKVPASPKPSWQEKCLQAAKQCRNPWLPELVAIPGGTAGLIAFARRFEQCYLMWESDKALDKASPEALCAGNVLAVVGPEGGFSDQEAQRLLDAGFRAASLGRGVLRWETAAILCLGLGYWARQKAGNISRSPG